MKLDLPFPRSRRKSFEFLFRLPILVIGCNAAKGQSSPNDPGDWINLFDGKSLAGWSSTEFGGEGKVAIENGNIYLEMGSPLSGITYAGQTKLPRFDYELRLQARRMEGSDFFCGLTFPYGDSHCTLILGGWGGGLTGISSLDGNDASENETTGYHKFVKDRWYQVRLRVHDGSIYAWLDDKQIVVCAVQGRKVDTRPEVNRSKPLGIASFETVAEFRDIQIRNVPPLPKRAQD